MMIGVIQYIEEAIEGVLLEPLDFIVVGKIIMKKKCRLKKII